MNAYSQLYRLALPLLVFSLVTNLGVLVSPLFMMQVLDRVIPSGNTATLLLLGLLALGALALQAMVESARDLCLGRLSRWTERVGATAALLPQQSQPQSVIEDVAQFSRFLSGSAAIAALSLPWMPVFLIALWFVHPSFVALLLLMVLMAGAGRLLAKLLVEPKERAAGQLAAQEQEVLTDASQFGVRAGVAMIAHNLRQRFVNLQSQRHQHLDARQAALSMNTGLASFVRSAGQVLALGLGAYLVTADLLSAGGMIAASIILAKGYGTIEGILTQMPQIKASLNSFRALVAMPATKEGTVTEVSEFSGELTADTLVVPRGGGAPPRLDRISLRLKAGECLAIVGASGSGKSTLLAAMAGTEPAPIGAVFLDQSEVKALSAATLYQATGYVPQHAALLPGTIAENIACFSMPRDDSKVLTAAKLAGVHGLISALPASYDTDLRTDAHMLSAGQAHRIALARAVYNTPKYLFLDEPNALLDADGERALAQTLARLKDAGTTIVMVLHRSGIMGLADKVMRIEHGRCVDLGPRAEVLGRLGANNRNIELPLLEAALQDLSDWVDAQFTRASDAEFSQKAQLIATELFNLARAAAPKDELRHARFSFTFVDDTHCELQMTGPDGSETATTLETVRARMQTSDTFLGDLTPEEAALATVSKLSQRFEVSSAEDATVFRVAMQGGVPREANSTRQSGSAIN
ncbi:ATP-binding cassette domain-containing protein [Shimia ponticola]|uniref:ATP-binding cassette domain-containing protein n=1 Tax=Shimia ponticola TaxID=2582893 RepID=UPI0011BD6D7E|nr:ATP-binding cassette domain-containing protein [Shimia ponticola]